MASRASIAQRRAIAVAKIKAEAKELSDRYGISLPGFLEPIRGPQDYQEAGHLEQIAVLMQTVRQKLDESRVETTSGPVASSPPPEPSDGRDDLMKLKKDELLARAKEIGAEVSDDNTKAEIASAIMAKLSGGSEGSGNSDAEG